MKYDIVTILGPTATGKTKLSALLAYHFNGEIISADSRQVYKKLNLGSGKDLNDYKIKNKTIGYYLIDIVEPDEEFNLFLFKQNFIKSYNFIKSKNKLPFLVGGTGLYLSSILQNYSLLDVNFGQDEVDELRKTNHEKLITMLKKLNNKLHNSTDLIDKERTIKAILIEKNKHQDYEQDLRFNSFNIGIKIDKAHSKENIRERLKKRLDERMIDEVKNLIEDGVSPERLISFGLEYKFITLYLKHELNYNDMFQKLESAINNFAKRQMTWFRKMEREGIKINWIEGPDFPKAKDLIESSSI
jgi:tRNA dimethylallyltransferase